MTDLPETFDDLVDKRRFWPGAAGSLDEGLGMLRLLTPDVVADAAKEIQTGRRVCLNWDLEKLDPPGMHSSYVPSCGRRSTDVSRLWEAKILP